MQVPVCALIAVELQVLDDRPESKTANLTLEGQGIIFPDNLDMMDYHQAIVECSWSPELGKWRFMRTRPDKDIPNAYRTYTKVWQSIQDNIGEEQLLDLGLEQLLRHCSRQVEQHAYVIWAQDGAPVEISPFMQ